MRRLAAALVHYPVLDRQGAIVTTAITNLDLHDIARSAHTYGLSDFFVIHPVAAQRELAERVREHWTLGSGARRIPDRTPAMRGVTVVETLEDAVGALGGNVELWTTSAQVRERSVSHAEARARLAGDGAPVMLTFGTGWGLAEAVYSRADAHLDPIVSLRSDGYNHLSVRAAAAILFDRLCGAR
ncbi:MAG TPA: RNA methyltransferase [Polyangiaceae bacterium]|nr:RNA methyltransferase [Polyangiaceae bacterium]